MEVLKQMQMLGLVSCTLLGSFASHLQVGGGVYITDNRALTTLGSLPNTLGTVGGLVDVSRNGAIPAAQVGLPAVLIG
jgi:hypothetical protein